MSVDPSLLKAFPLFKDFTEEDYRGLSYLVDRRTLENGEVLLRQGEAHGGFYFVLDGMLSVFRELPDGQDIFLARLEKGQVAGYLSLIDNKPRTATIRSVGSTRVGLISETDFHLLFSSNTTLGLRFQQAIARDIVRSLRLVNRRFTIAATLPVQDFRSPAHLDGLYDDLDTEQQER